MFEDFPGFLGYGSIISIHANWPIYPGGIGWKIGLRNLGNFPVKTTFFEVDDIDGCMLFLNSNPTSNIKNSLNVALWHEDLIELQINGYIDGVKPVTQYHWELNKFENLKKQFGKHLLIDKKGNIILHVEFNGKIKKTVYEKPKNYDDEDLPTYTSFVIVPKSIKLTEKGLKKLHEINQEITFNNELENHIRPFLDIGKFDTVIREASLLIETKIKQFHNKENLYGFNLITFHIQQVIKANGNMNTAAIKCYEGELKTAFAFVRNDFAHNFKNITLDNCRSILHRINNLYNQIDEVIEAYFK